MRDTNTYVVLGIGVVLAAAALLTLVRHAWIAPKLAVVALLVVLVGGAGLAVSMSTVHGWDPLRHVLADRIIPYPDRLDWWIDHGMPQGPALRRLAEDPGRTDTGHRRQSVRRHVTGSSGSTRSGWKNGARTYIEWLVTHPTYTLFEPFESPERVHLRRTVTNRPTPTRCR